MTANRLLANDVALDHLEIAGLHDHFNIIVDALMYNTCVTKLTVTSCVLDDKSVRHLAGTIKVNERIESLRLDDCDFPPGGLVRVIKAVGKNEMLEKVKFVNMNMLTNEDFDAIAENWESHPSLKHVAIYATEAEDNDLAARRLAELLHRSNVTGLGIDTDVVTDEFISSVCTADDQHPHGVIGRLLSLSVIEQEPTYPTDITPILKCVKSAGVVTKLSITGYDGTCKVQLLADIVRTVGSLKKIILYMEPLIDEEAAMLTMLDTLKWNKSVRKAKFIGAIITDRIKRAYFEMLRANDTLTTFDVPGDDSTNGMIKFFIDLNRAHAARVDAIDHALKRAWVRANRPGDTHAPLSVMPKELVPVIAALTTRDTDPSPLDHWSAVQIANWEDGKTPIDPLARTGTRTMSPDNEAKRVARG